MNTVFEPSMLFIAEEDWLIESKQDDFLQHLFMHLTWINELEISSIYWTHDLEECLWKSPQSPPWRKDKDWRNRIVPIIYKMFAARLNYLDNSEYDSRCIINPPIKPVFNDGTVCNSFRKMMHVLLVRNENVYLCYGVLNKIVKGKKRSFKCSCHSQELIPQSLYQPSEWVDNVDWITKLWPNGNGLESCNKLLLMIAIFSGWQPGKPQPQYKYDYSFTKTFLDDLASEKQHRANIIQSLLLRLNLTQKEAGLNGSLKDEGIGGRNKIRRFRVTGEVRIHYIYKGERHICFTNYYGEGKHDNGLK